MDQAGAGSGGDFREHARRWLPLEILAPLARVSPWASTRALLQTFGLIAAMAAFAVAFWWWRAALLAIVLMAPLARALLVPAREAARCLLFESRGPNAVAGRVCATLPGSSLRTCRVMHGLHHNHLRGPEDADIALHGGCPRGRAHLLRSLARDLAGLAAWKTCACFFGAPAANADTGRASRPPGDTSPALRRAALRDGRAVLAFHVAAPAAARASGWGWHHVVLRAAPQITLLQAILRLRALREHGAVADLPRRSPRRPPCRPGLSRASSCLRTT